MEELQIQVSKVLEEEEEVLLRNWNLEAVFRSMQQVH